MIQCYRNCYRNSKNACDFETSQTLYFLDSKGLGPRSEKPGELVHHEFNIYWERYKTNFINDPKYGNRLKKAVVEFYRVIYNFFLKLIQSVSKVFVTHKTISIYFFINVTTINFS